MSRPNNGQSANVNCLDPMSWEIKMCIKFHKMCNGVETELEVIANTAKFHLVLLAKTNWLIVKSPVLVEKRLSSLVPFRRKTSSTLLFRVYQLYMCALVLNNLRNSYIQIVFKYYFYLQNTFTYKIKFLRSRNISNSAYIRQSSTEGNHVVCRLKCR